MSEHSRISDTFSLAIGSDLRPSPSPPWESPFPSHPSSDQALSKPTEHKQPTTPSKPVLKQRNSATLNKARHKPSIRQQRSKLHLIDDTTLTSLPLPPPPSNKWFRRRNSELSMEPSSLSNVDGDSSLRAKDSKYQSFCDLTKLPTHSDVDCDDSFADSQDPIVLVEDYMAGAAELQSEETLLRKQSLANFKKRARDDQSRCSSDSTIDTCPSSFGNAETFSLQGPKEDLEAMFGTIPGSDKLKHCTLCDKPLYEISSLLNSTVAQTHIHKLYNELVCSGCINTYQQVLDEMYQAEINRAPGCASLSKTFNSLREVYEKDNAAFMQMSNASSQKRVKRQFSRHLIGRLQNLSELSSPQQNEPGWLKTLQNKFNWKT